MPIQAVARSSAVASPSSKAVDFSHFSPTKISAKGNAVSLTGNINRSVVGEVRSDAKGKITVSSHMWTAKPGVDHPASKAELKQLKASLTQFLSTARLTKPAGEAYQKLMGQIDAALKPGTQPKVSTVVTQRALMAANHALKGGNLKWNPSMPLGVRYVEVPLFSEKHPDGYHYSALFPVGALSPSAKPTDPNLASNFILKRSGGLAGLTSYAGPINFLR